MSDHLSLPATPYQPRRTELLGVQTLGDWNVKVIGITASGDLPDPTETEAALVAAERALPQPALGQGRHGIGFVIVHRGVEALWVLVCWWELDILHHKMLRAPLGTTDLVGVREDSLTACVWELLAIDHERRAWITHVLQRPDSPDFDAYLAQAFTAATANLHQTEPTPADVRWGILVDDPRHAGRQL